MRENATIYSNAVNIKGRDCISKYLYHYSRNVYMDLVRERFGKDQMTDRLIYSIDFNSHGSASMTKEWFEKGLNEPPELVAERMYCGMPPDLRNYF